MIGKLPFHDLFSAPMIRLQHPSAQHIVLHSACVIYWTPYEQVGDVDQSSLHYTGLSLVFFFLRRYIVSYSGTNFYGMTVAGLSQK